MSIGASHSNQYPPKTKTKQEKKAAHCLDILCAHVAVLTRDKVTETAAKQCWIRAYVWTETDACVVHFGKTTVYHKHQEHVNIDKEKRCSLRWFGTVLGRTKCANFFVKTYCLWHKQLENEIMLGGHRAPFFRKWVRTLLFSTFLSMEWMGKRWLACL